MPYKLQPGRMYMMPTHFGPATGPRQGPDGRRFDGRDSPRTTSYSVSFLTRPEQLEVLLPMGFRLAGDPVVTVTVSYMTEVEWLAGRGYNTLGGEFPGRVQGETGPGPRPLPRGVVGEPGRSDSHREGTTRFLEDILRDPAAVRAERRDAVHGGLARVYALWK